MSTEQREDISRGNIGARYSRYLLRKIVAIPHTRERGQLMILDGEKIIFPNGQKLSVAYEYFEKAPCGNLLITFYEPVAIPLANGEQAMIDLLMFQDKTAIAARLLKEVVYSNATGHVMKVPAKDTLYFNIFLSEEEKVQWIQDKIALGKEQITDEVVAVLRSLCDKRQKEELLFEHAGGTLYKVIKEKINTVKDMELKRKIIKEMFDKDI